MGQDKVQRFLPLAGRADGLDEIVARSGRYDAQRGIRMHQPGGGFADRAVAAHGDDRFHAPAGGVAGQFRGMTRIFRIADDEIHLFFLQIAFGLLTDLLCLSVPCRRIDDDLVHEYPFLPASFLIFFCILPEKRQKRKEKM